MTDREEALRVLPLVASFLNRESEKHDGIAAPILISWAETVKTAHRLLDATRWRKISPAGIYECEKCGQNVMTGDIEAYKYCHGCGRMVEDARQGNID